MPTIEAKIEAIDKKIAAHNEDLGSWGKEAAKLRDKIKKASTTVNELEAQKAALSKLARMGDEERAALAQALGVTGIESAEDHGKAGAK